VGGSSKAITDLSLYHISVTLLIIGIVKHRAPAESEAAP
jgi:hypothetical protein